jgi:hypothetical protein
MNRLTDEEEIRKRAIFDGLSLKRKEKILKRGYENWDPFAPPNDPIDLRRDSKKHTALMLTRKFLANCPQKDINTLYSQGVWEMCVGLMSGSDRYRGMYEFSCWYKDFLKEEKKEDI